MKKHIIYLIIGMIFVGGGSLPTLAQKSGVPQYNPKYLREKDPVFEQVATEMTPNGWIIFKKEAKIKASTFFNTYATNLGIGQHYEFQLMKDETDVFHIRHQRFQLYYKKTIVAGAEFTLHSVDDILQTAHGRIVENMDFDLSKPMPEQKALDYALSDKNLSKADFKGEQKPPQGKLTIAQVVVDNFDKSSFQLAYAFDVYGKRGSLDAHTVYVDASDGRILKREPLFLNCFDPNCNTHAANKNVEPTNEPKVITHSLVASTFTPRFNNRYGNPLNFESENSPNGFRLSMNNGALVTRRDANNIFDGSSNVEATFNGNLDIQNPATGWGTNQQNSTTTHWAVQKAYQYFNNTFGRNGPSNDGNIARVLTDTREVNARWWGGGVRMISIRHF